MQRPSNFYVLYDAKLLSEETHKVWLDIWCISPLVDIQHYAAILADESKHDDSRYEAS